VKFSRDFLRYDRATQGLVNLNTRAADRPAVAPHEKEYIMLKITDLEVKSQSLGNKFWLVEVSPAYEYQNNRRTDTVLGYRYTVALPEKGLEKINVRIDGDKLMDSPDGYVEVRFDGLEVFIYWSQGQPQVGAKATGIHLVNLKA
jgi:hypothetical protein